MKNFEQYNESIRDKMTPKSKEDIKNSFESYIDSVNKKIFASHAEFSEEDYDTALEKWSMIKYGKVKYIKIMEKLMDEGFVRPSEITRIGRDNLMMGLGLSDMEEGEPIFQILDWIRKELK